MSDTHKAHDCPYCWRVLYSKGALTRHLNAEHWEEVEALAVLDASLEESENGSN